MSGDEEIHQIDSDQVHALHAEALIDSLLLGLDDSRAIRALRLAPPLPCRLEERAAAPGPEDPSPEPSGADPRRHVRDARAAQRRPTPRRPADLGRGVEGRPGCSVPLAG